MDHFYGYFLYPLHFFYILSKGETRKLFAVIHQHFGEAVYKSRLLAPLGVPCVDIPPPLPHLYTVYHCILLIVYDLLLLNPDLKMLLRTVPQ